MFGHNASFMHLQRLVTIAAALIVGCARHPGSNSSVASRGSTDTTTLGVAPAPTQPDVQALCGLREDVFILCETYDWRAVAFAIDGRIVCPKRTPPDTTLMADFERITAVRRDSIESIEVVKVVPDSVQRGCRDRLQKVIYLRTKWPCRLTLLTS